MGYGLCVTRSADVVNTHIPYPVSHNEKMLQAVPEILGIAVLAAMAWLWLDSLKVREAAVRAAKEICAAEGLLFLDDTVAISGIRLARGEDGTVRLQRAYDFEFSDTGNNRLKGSLVMLGHRLMLLNVGSASPTGVRTLH
jgi:hypothetical protein